MARKLILVLMLGTLFVLTGCKEQIMHDLSEGEANRLLTRLHQVDISAEKKLQPDGSWALAVERSQVVEALGELSNTRVFRRSRSESSRTSSSMIPSRDAQRFEFERALSQEIEMTLETLTGVLEARVHLNIPMTDPLLGSKGAEASQRSGSVLLITDDQFVGSVEEIRGLVGGAAGIAAEGVTVVRTPTPSAQETIEERSEEIAPREPPVVIERSVRFTSASSPSQFEILLWVMLLFSLGLVAVRVAWKKPTVFKKRSEEGSDRFAFQLEGLAPESGRMN